MYKELDVKQVNELTLLRHGWWSPQYELTNNTAVYGQLSYQGISKRNATATIANGSWRFNFEAFFSRTILITDEKGIVIGQSTREFFSRRRTLALQSSFTAEFYRPSLFSREYVWESAGNGKIMSIKNNFPFTLTTDIHLYQTQTPARVVPLMIFLGAHLIILRRRKKAAH